MTQIDSVIRLARETLGADVLGMYVLGSAASGGLRPHSDTDVLAVLRRHTTEPERRQLTERLMEISGERAHGGPQRPVELTLVVREEVVPWRYPPRREFQYGEWLRAEYERGHTPAPEVDPDLAPLVTMVLQADTPLVGPPPGELLEPVPRADLNEALAACVPELLEELETDTRNVVLRLSRIWMTLSTGEITSKDAAADWSLARLPAEHRPPLAHARAVYLGQEQESWEALRPDLGPYATYVVAAIRRAMTS